MSKITTDSIRIEVSSAEHLERLIGKENSDSIVNRDAYQDCSGYILDNLPSWFSEIPDDDKALIYVTQAPPSMDVICWVDISADSWKSPHFDFIELAEDSPCAFFKEDRGSRAAISNPILFERVTTPLYLYIAIRDGDGNEFESKSSHQAMMFATEWDLEELTKVK